MQTNYGVQIIEEKLCFTINIMTDTPGISSLSCFATETYTGNFQNGLRHNSGDLEIVDCENNVLETYKGYWVNDLKHGYGEQIRYLNGNINYDKYTGEFYENVMQGNGTGIKFSNDLQIEQIYSGQWFDDQKHGTGINKYNNIVHYENNKLI